jgi:hypothetical protein
VRVNAFERPHFLLINRPQKQNGRSAEADRPNLVLNRGLQRLDVGSLQTLRATHDFELNGLAVVQGLVAFRLDRGKMYEYIFPGLALDEAKALAGVKPLHGSLFFAHFVFLFSSLKLSGALLRILSRGLPSSAAFCGSAQRAQKKAASLTLRPLHKTKGDTRATNANSVYQKKAWFASSKFRCFPDKERRTNSSA